MRFEPTPVAGAFFMKLDAHVDERGLFARTYCEEVFAAAGVPMHVCQTNISRNPNIGTLRGMHFQALPYEEAKIVHCVRGSVFDAIVDLRPTSLTYCRTAWTRLSADEERLVYVPPGCAHGFLTLAPHSDLIYYMGAPYVAGAGQGVRWNDPAFAIAWPDKPKIISGRDATFPDFTTRSEKSV